MPRVDIVSAINQQCAPFMARLALSVLTRTPPHIRDPCVVNFEHIGMLLQRHIYHLRRHKLSDSRNLPVCPLHTGKRVYRFSTASQFEASAGKQVMLGSIMDSLPTSA
jgi:hypothetical protein